MFYFLSLFVALFLCLFFFFFFSSRRRHTRLTCDWSSDVCSSDLAVAHGLPQLRSALASPKQAKRCAAGFSSSKLAQLTLLSGEIFMNYHPILLRARHLIFLLLAIVTLAAAQNVRADEGQYQILRAR